MTRDSVMIGVQGFKNNISQCTKRIFYNVQSIKWVKDAENLEKSHKSKVESQNLEPAIHTEFIITYNIYMFIL